jgi:transcriptional regulatory protein LevR
MEDMPFRARFELLRDTGQIDAPAIEAALDVIRAIDAHYGRQLDEENAAMFVTHMVMAFERLMRHEELNEVPGEVLEEVQQYPGIVVFVTATVTQALEPYRVQAPEAELAYLALHLSAIQQAAERGNE